MFKRGYKARYVRIVFRAKSWKAPFKFLKWRKMSSKKEYDLVSNDDYDTRIPLHPDEAFQYGITFRAKYIGTMEVPRPSSRVEIVAAMRRVRYEFKSKGVKKRKVTVDVSTNGVRVTLRTKKNQKKGKRKFFSRRRKSDTSCETLELMNHPIYRIFYVSHDSSDLKIFSYIARDGATNEFKCNVFKSSKKSQAMRIVRTVGQAFEVCHKMQANTQDNPVPSTSSAADEQASCSFKDNPPKEPASECGGSDSGGASTSKVIVEEPPREGKKPAVRPKHLDLLPPPPKKEGKRTTQPPASVPSINLPDLPECVTKVEIPNAPESDATTPLSAQHQMKLLRERLEQQAQQTQAAVAQLLLLRDQLAAEQAARCEAQARTHQLLVHNKELLEHIAALVAHLQDREEGNARPINAQQLTLLPQSQKQETMNGFEGEANGNRQLDDDELISFIVQNSNSKSEKQNLNAVNNNVRKSFSPSPTVPGPSTSTGPDFGTMTNEQIQNYLIAKFQSMPFLNGQGDDDNRQFYQNSNAFPHIPPISSHFSNSDLASLLNNQMKGASGSSDEFGGLAQAMSIGHSQNSLDSNSPDSSSKDSSPDSSSEDGLPYIMPLSHNATLKATSDDGRVRLIVPVSPSESAADVQEAQKVSSTSNAGSSLQVPGAGQSPITRTTSEKVPNRSELMAALRAQWTRHTTK